MNKDGKHQVEHFDDFPSRKVRKVKNLLMVLNCQVKKKSKVEVVKAFLFLGEKLKNAKSQKKRKVKKKNEKSKSRKVEKSKKKKRSKSRKVPRPGDLCSKSRKNWKFKNSKSRKVEKSNTFWFFAKSFTWKVEKIKSSKSRKVEKPKSGTLFDFWRTSFTWKVEKIEKSKSQNLFDFLDCRQKFHLKSRKNRKVEKSKSQNLFDFLDFCEKLCNFRAVRLPARGAVSQTYALPGFQLTNEWNKQTGEFT